MSKSVSLPGGVDVKFQIWDTAGQERYHSLAPMYYRGAQCAIVAYDITSSRSFRTMNKWVDELKDLGPGGIQIIVVGNKCDLEEDRQVTTASARQYAKSIRGMFIETSAKMNVNVDQAFTDLAKKLVAMGKLSTTRGSSRGGVGPLRNRDGAGGGCC